MNDLKMTQSSKPIDHAKHTPITDGIVIDTTAQMLYLYAVGVCVLSAPVSTAKNGTGQMMNSGCTPLGKHRIAAKIGDGAPVNAVFVGRVATGEVYDEALALAHPERDWILTRILWLDGLELGFNKGENADGSCDTYARYIYIHGTPDSEAMGVPLSHGCIRMRHDALLDLFERVQVDTPVVII